MCEAAREGTGAALPRTQSSIAVRAGSGPWFLVNASPDLRAQLETLPVDGRDGLRVTPFAAILLTDGEIDHTAGLLLLRESDRPLRIYSSSAVRDALSDQFPVLRMLERYCGVDWSPLEPGTTVELAGGLTAEAFATGGDPPLYVGGEDGPTSLGLTFRDETHTLTYAPALAAVDDAILVRLAASDCVLVDGTFWSADELVALGLGTRDAHSMGHLPLSGPAGSLAVVGRREGRTVLVHVNNTNPILLERSHERALVEASGVEVAYDGMEIVL